MYYPIGTRLLNELSDDWVVDELKLVLLVGFGDSFHLTSHQVWMLGEQHALVVLA